MHNQNTLTIEDNINRQLKANKSKNLLYANVDQTMDIEPDFLAALEKLLDTAAGEMPDGVSPEMVSFAAKALLKRVNAVNQYIQVSDQKVAELEEIYRQTWQVMVQTRNVRTTLREYHYPKLSQWVATLYPKEFRKHLRYKPEVGHVVNEEYSAEFQIELFQLDILQMRAPVIDIGCGNQANLVRYLRSRGIDAYGFDRTLEVHEPYLEQIDWFVYPFRKDSWGTIISNMAFTNHLNYAYLHDVSQLEFYLLRLKDILESLVIGGSFFYAPALPFVEDRLAPESYRVERKLTAGEIFVSAITRLV
jgi:hypothetical protein